MSVLKIICLGYKFMESMHASKKKLTTTPLVYPMPTYTKAAL